MLPLPNLDDRTFEELVREARDLIPGYYPEWTDENEHDPGITLLELLAWHIEMQQFQLDRLTTSHERKFLKLLGERPRDRRPAMTSVSFSKAAKQQLLPYGTLLHVGDLPFETVRPLTILSDTSRHIFVHTGDGSYEISDDFESGSAPFYPFGEACRAGSSMIIEFDEPLPIELPLSLWFQLNDQEPDYRIPARYTSFTPSGKVEWSYWQLAAMDAPDEGVGEAEGSGRTDSVRTGSERAGLGAGSADGAAGSWQPIDLERDESYGFHQSGPILFKIPAGAGPVYRIRGLLTAGEYSDPPHIRRIMWNEVFVKQGQSVCVSELFDGSRPNDQPLHLAHALFQLGEIAVQLKHENGGWVDLDESQYTCMIGEGSAALTFREDVLLPAGKGSIRAIAVDHSFTDFTYLGVGTGISGQTYPLPIQPIYHEEFQLQVGWQMEERDQTVWYDWEPVLDFDESNASSRHYVIDEEEGVIRFSDGLYGAVPPRMPYPNIRIISYRTGVGQAGNIKASTINRMDGDESLLVTNLYPAYGGAEPETLKEAIQRARLSILEPGCGVTAEDLERRAMEIPGLRIARVKAIPGYKTSLSNYPEERSFGDISIVVVPYSKQSWPKPSEGMIQTVRRHLEPYRLLTTTFHIIPPEYVTVTVRAIIVVDPRYEGRESEVQQVLSQWLQPYGKDSLMGWEFGRPIYKSDVYDIIHRVPGVRFIQDVWLMADGKDVYRDEGGDIRIPPNGLVISGLHEIEFMTTF